MIRPAELAKAILTERVEETSMSDRMTPISFPDLMAQIITEKKKHDTVFGVKRAYHALRERGWTFFGKPIETPFGPAAGPHTQLAQNLVAAYYAGSRFFELKTVQTLDGEDLVVSKPCILSLDECYNCEWSTELKVSEAFDEYVKAWIAIKVIAKEFDLGASDGFRFNASVGYSLDGIRSEKIDAFIEGLKDASETPVFKACTAWLRQNAALFEKFGPEDAESISPFICDSVTLSTLHGCPAHEIERIAAYLIDEKNLNTFVKCNPTLLGYDFTRKTLDDMGYDYIAFGDLHFREDLPFVEAVPMIGRLQEKAAAKGLAFGVKISNTLPVDITAGELPGKEMYMSGKALFALSMTVAARLAEAFHGNLRISFSGGADFFNIGEIVDAGIWPVTMASTLLKPGGYQRLTQIAGLFERVKPAGFSGTNAEKAYGLAEAAKTDLHHTKPIKPQPSRKINLKLPLTDCFMTPCREGCPIRQDCSAYLKLVDEGKYFDALKVITEKNPLPFITGTICVHNCMDKCTRNHYEQPVNIRRAKLEAAEGGIKELMRAPLMPEKKSDRKAAVVGAGPAGLAAAWFLAKSGIETTVFEKREKAGGVVRYAIPGFRIPEERIDRDIELIRTMGVHIVTGKEVTDVAALKKQYDAVVLAVGAPVPGTMDLKSGTSVNALDFLEEFKRTGGKMNIGRRVVVIGGGNTAMDTARAAKRTSGVTQVAVVYRRTKRYMPADEEELEMLEEEGIEFLHLLAPVMSGDGKMICSKMTLGEPGADGRRSVSDTGVEVCIACDTVISAVGEKVPEKFYLDNGIAVDKNGRPAVDKKTNETSLAGVYAVGDGLSGPASVVEAIRDATVAAEAIAGAKLTRDYDDSIIRESVIRKKGILKDEDPSQSDSSRCLSCGAVCENCVEVCPNRANVSIQVPGFRQHQILHLDRLCNECGNCACFCPYDSAPYRDKWTLFANEADMGSGSQQGFTVTDSGTGACKVRLDGEIFDYIPGEETADVPDGIAKIIGAVLERYEYLI